MASLWLSLERRGFGFLSSFKYCWDSNTKHSLLWGALLEAWSTHLHPIERRVLLWSHIAVMQLQLQWVQSAVTEGNIPDSKVHGANMGPIWGRQDPGGLHVGPMNLTIWDPMVELHTGHLLQHLHKWQKLCNKTKKMKSVICNNTEMGKLYHHASCDCVA